MAFKKDAEFFYEFKENGIDEVIDEAPGSNSFIAIREVRWGPEKEFKLDIRKYICKADGSEVIGKGVSFATEDGPNCLINTLVDHGYGSTGDILDKLSHRDDFTSSLARTIKSAIEIDKNFKSKVEKAYDEACSVKSGKDMLAEIL